MRYSFLPILLLLCVLGCVKVNEVKPKYPSVSSGESYSSDSLKYLHIFTVSKNNRSTLQTYLNGLAYGLSSYLGDTHLVSYVNAKSDSLRETDSSDYVCYFSNLQQGYNGSILSMIKENIIDNGGSADMYNEVNNRGFTFTIDSVQYEATLHLFYRNTNLYSIDNPTSYPHIGVSFFHYTGESTALQMQYNSNQNQYIASNTSVGSIAQTPTWLVSFRMSYQGRTFEAGRMGGCGACIRSAKTRLCPFKTGRCECTGVESDTSNPHED